MIAASLAVAQTSGDPSGSTPAPKQEAAAASNEAASIPDPEKMKRSAGALTEMRGALKQVLEKLEEARNSKDVVKLNCVNENLTQIKGLLRISEQADVALQEAVAKHETQSAEHEYTKVSIAQGKVKELRAKAEQCIGQLAFRTDENQSVVVDEPEDLPSGDPTEVVPMPPVVTRLPAASPTM
jgi:hypothetical protein